MKREQVVQNTKWILIVGILILLLGAAVFTAGRMLNRGVSPAASPASNLDPNEALLAFAQCMRDNGVPDFPDPVDDGINLGGTGIDRNSPGFKDAEKACETLLPGPSSNTGGNSAWQKVVPGGDTKCADSSEFAFWDREADPTKVVFYLDGGGVC